MNNPVTSPVTTPAQTSAQPENGKLLRVAINIGNSLLAHAGEPGTDPTGISVDIARRLASELQCPLALLIYASAGAVFAAKDDDKWDVAFLAIDPERAKHLSFSQPYVQIEGTYLVPINAPHTRCLQLDEPGHRIATERNAAYDLHLSRSLLHAQTDKAEPPQTAFELFEAKGLDAAAGIRQELEAIAAGCVGFRVLEDCYMTIWQAVVTQPQGWVNSVAVNTLVAQLKTDGWLTQTLAKHGLPQALAAH